MANGSIGNVCTRKAKRSGEVGRAAPGSGLGGQLQTLGAQPRGRALANHRRVRGKLMKLGIQTDSVILMPVDPTAVSGDILI